MERLTIEYCGFYVPIEACTINIEGEADDCLDCAEMCGQMAGECDNCCIQKCFEKLGIYEDLEEQRQLFYVPCKAGDIVYKLDPRSGQISQHEVAKIECIISKSDFVIEIIFTIAGSCRGSDFGKTIFTQKSAAIAILNMQEDKQ